ncbi:MbnP family protein [Hymenobacter sp. B81]|uniref:MbnP family protein n=1 Tax=Hymenobacter sp. B81 TaxID=3344878 RepID=UPI0037DCA75D
MIRPLLFRSLLLLASSALVSACHDEGSAPEPEPAPGRFNLHFDHVAGGSPLVLNTGEYTTGQGETFRVSDLRYYVSNLHLTRADGSTWVEPNSYRLIAHGQATAQHATVQGVPAGEYTAISFLIGVDSLRNTAGAQTGALDPSHNMFWDWNQGYVFFRLVGSSPQAPGQALGYDVAGFRHPFNTLRTVRLTLPGGAALRIRADNAPEVHIKADVLRLFDGPHPIRLAQTYFVAGGADAMKLADNYAAGMFRIDHVHGN